ncbi:MAG TPA: cytochrome c-type biogenesis protein CcmH [Azospirillaceae bacterium]|nr:cytochrome c-type biogenesis protein CcmH [Azospirillaceae bacterium]HRQ82309.1 cytochrome c-type biogenesis protein CcmH [Azospirillaceae bacterium]
MTALRFVLPLAAAMLASVPALAVQPGEILPDPALETRAREISKDLRCLVCQNQSIDDSNAPLARDLRIIVRERLVKGDSNQQVLSYVTDRYGDFVLLKPPFKATTWALWLAGPLFLLFGGWAAARFLRSHGAAGLTAKGGEPAFEAPLSEDENRRLAQLLAKDKDNA